MTIHPELLKLIEALQEQDHTVEVSKNFNNLIYIMQDTGANISIEYLIGSDKFILLGKQLTFNQLMGKLVNRLT
ncbi:hypothetical protein GCM10028895_10340 [Pontibacter rugosus]